MAAFVLPCQSTPTHNQFQTDLDGATYGFEFYWNERADAWFVSLYDVAENPLVTGVRVVVGFPLLTARPTNAALPPGSIIAIDTSGNNEDPGQNDLGARVQLVYYSVAQDGQ